MEEAHFSAKPNEPGQYVEEGRKHIKTVFFNKEGKITGAFPESRRLICGTKVFDEKKRTELYEARGEKKGAIEESFDGNGRLMSKTVYEYDSAGQTRAYSWTIYDGLGSIGAKWESKNDEHGLQIERAIYLAENHNPLIGSLLPSDFM
jgi:hypothetical protein